MFEEGINLPIGFLFREGEVNQVLMDILLANVRDPRAAEGDLYSLTACNQAGSNTLLASMDEFELDDLDTLADFICDKSLAAVQAEIANLPNGVS